MPITQPTAAGTATIDAADRPLLLWLAQGVAASAFAAERLPAERDIPPSLLTQELTLGQAVERAQRWVRLLVLIRSRSEKCSLALARSFIADGFDRATVQSAVHKVAPRLDLSQLPPLVDRGYVEAEITYLAAPSYEAAVRLARASAPYDPELAHGVVTAAASAVTERYDAELCLAWICERTGRADRACEHYAAAAAKGCETCRAAWARAANRAGRHQTALDIVNGARLLRPADLLVEKARALRALRTPAEALAAYRDVNLGEAAERVDVEAEIADCQFALGHYREAAVAAQVPARSGSRLARRVLSLALYRQRNWAEAVPALRSFVATVPVDAEAWRALAESCLMLGRDTEAAEAAQTVLRHDPQDRDAARLLGQAAVRLRRYDEALDICTRYGWDILPYPYLARVFIDTNQLEAAAEFIAVWSDRRPGDVLAWMYKGYLAERSGRLRDALACYEEAMRRKPDYREAMQRCELLHAALEDGETA